MSLTRKQKEHSVNKVQESISAASSVVFLAYNGLTVEEVNELRGNLHAIGGSMRVVPKRLLKIALHNIKLDFDPTAHAGQLAVVWGDDAVAPAKTLNAFVQKRQEKIRFLAGTLEGNMLSLEEVTSLSKLPSRDELIANLVSVIAGPTRGLVTVLSGIPRRAVRVLRAIAEQKGSANSTA